MSSSPQLDIPHITAGQDDKETTANEAVDALDNAVNRAVFVELNASTGNDQELDEATAFRRGLIVLNGTHDGSATDPFLFYLPATEKAYTVVNESSGEVEVLGLGDSAGTGVFLSVGDVAAIHYDGSRFRAVSGGATSGGGGGGASSLADLDDVQTAATDLQDGDVLTWDALIGAWVPGEGGTGGGGGGGATSLSDLDDVQTAATDLQDGDALIYSATVGAWVPGEAGSGGGGGASALGDLDDVDVAATDLADGDSLVYDATMGEWRPGAPVTSIATGVRVRHRGALVRTGALSGVSPPIIFTHDEAVYDTDDFWAGSDADVLVIPPSLDGAKVRVSAGYLIDGITLTNLSNTVFQILKNGSDAYVGGATGGAKSGYSNTGPSGSIATAVIEVAQGDEFSCRFNASDASVNFADVWLCVEVVEEPNAAPYSVSVNAQTGTTYTATLSDAQNVVTMDNASANTFTVPANADVAYPVGTLLTVKQIGAGTTTVEGASGVQLNGVTAGSAALDAQWATVGLLKIATDAWALDGQHGTVS